MNLDSLLDDTQDTTTAITWRLEKRPVADLREWEHNPRKMKAAGLKDLKRSIQAFGLAEPLVVQPDGSLIGGHGRLRVIREEGIPEVDCYIPSRQLTDAERDELGIRLNKNIAGVWDLELLTSNWGKGLLGDWGFTKAELRSLFSEKENRVDVPKERSKTEVLASLGEVWQLGRHRLAVGDCTDSDLVQSMMGDELADLVITSPPYNSGSSGFGRHKTFQGRNVTNIHPKLYTDYEDKLPSEKYLKLNHDTFKQFLSFVKEGGNVFYNVNYNSNSRSEYIRIVADAMDQGFNLYETIVWKKSSFMPITAVNTLSREYEFIFLFNRSDTYYTNRQKDVHRSNFWEVENSVQSTPDGSHSACFPVDLPIKILKEYAEPGQVVLDPYGGSGTTLLAAEANGYQGRLVEISPRYASVIIDRWQRMTGETAEKLL